MLSFLYWLVTFSLQTSSPQNSCAHVDNHLFWVLSPLYHSFQPNLMRTNSVSTSETLLYFTACGFSLLWELTVYSGKLYFHSGNYRILWLHGLKLIEGTLSPLFRYEWCQFHFGPYQLWPLVQAQASYIQILFLQQLSCSMFNPGRKVWFIFRLGKPRQKKSTYPFP